MPELPAGVCYSDALNHAGPHTPRNASTSHLLQLPFEVNTGTSDFNQVDHFLEAWLADPSNKASGGSGLHRSLSAMQQSLAHQESADGGDDTPSGVLTHQESSAAADCAVVQLGKQCKATGECDDDAAKLEAVDRQHSSGLYNSQQPTPAAEDHDVHHNTADAPEAASNSSMEVDDVVLLTTTSPCPGAAVSTQETREAMHECAPNPQPHMDTAGNSDVHHTHLDSAAWITNYDAHTAHQHAIGRCLAAEQQSQGDGYEPAHMPHDVPILLVKVLGPGHMAPADPLESASYLVSLLSKNTSGLEAISCNEVQMQHAHLSLTQEDTQHHIDVTEPSSGHCLHEEPDVVASPDRVPSRRSVLKGVLDLASRQSSSRLLRNQSHGSEGLLSEQAETSHGQSAAQQQWDHTAIHLQGMQALDATKPNRSFSANLANGHNKVQRKRRAIGPAGLELGAKKHTVAVSCYPTVAAVKDAATLVLQLSSSSYRLLPNVHQPNTLHRLQSLQQHCNPDQQAMHMLEDFAHSAGTHMHAHNVHRAFSDPFHDASLSALIAQSPQAQQLAALQESQLPTSHSYPLPANFTMQRHGSHGQNQIFKQSKFDHHQRRQTPFSFQQMMKQAMSEDAGVAGSGDTPSNRSTGPAERHHSFDFSKPLTSLSAVAGSSQLPYAPVVSSELLAGVPVGSSGAAAGQTTRSTVNGQRSLGMLPGSVDEHNHAAWEQHSFARASSRPSSMPQPVALNLTTARRHRRGQRGHFSADDHTHSFAAQGVHILESGSTRQQHGHGGIQRLAYLHSPVYSPVVGRAHSTNVMISNVNGSGLSAHTGSPGRRLYASSVQTAQYDDALHHNDALQRMHTSTSMHISAAKQQLQPHSSMLQAAATAPNNNQKTPNGPGLWPNTKPRCGKKLCRQTSHTMSSRG